VNIAHAPDRSVNVQAVNWDAVIGMDRRAAGGRAAGGLALLDRHPERVCRQAGGRVVADRPADHAAAERVEHDRAVDLALARRVLGDVGHPELVGALAAKDTVDEVLSRRQAGTPRHLRAPLWPACGRLIGRGGSGSFGRRRRGSVLRRRVLRTLLRS